MYTNIHKVHFDVVNNKNCSNSDSNTWGKCNIMLSVCLNTSDSAVQTFKDTLNSFRYLSIYCTLWNSTGTLDKGKLWKEKNSLLHIDQLLALMPFIQVVSHEKMTPVHLQSSFQTTDGQ